MADTFKKFKLKAGAKGSMMGAGLKSKLKKSKTPVPGGDDDDATPTVEVSFFICIYCISYRHKNFTCLYNPSQ